MTGDRTRRDLRSMRAYRNARDGFANAARVVPPPPKCPGCDRYISNREHAEHGKCVHCRIGVSS